MKATLIFLAAILVTCNAFVHGGDHMNGLNLFHLYSKGKLSNFLERIRNGLRHGDAELGIPVLDPAEILQYALSVNKEGLIQMDGLLTDIRSQGISGFTTNTADFHLSGLRTTISLTWPEFNARTNYAIKGNVLNSFDVYGSGEVTAVVKDFTFAVDLKFGVKNRKLHVSEAASKILLGGLDVKITGLYDDDDFSALVSSLVSELTPQFIQDYQEELTKVVDKYIIEVLDDILKDMTLKDLLKLINS